jgi:hypothetical protein
MIDGEDDGDCRIGLTVSSGEVGAGAPPTSQPTVGGYGFRSHARVSAIHVDAGPGGPSPSHAATSTRDVEYDDLTGTIADAVQSAAKPRTVNALFSIGLPSAVGSG